MVFPVYGVPRVWYSPMYGVVLFIVWPGVSFGPVHGVARCAPVYGVAWCAPVYGASVYGVCQCFHVWCGPEYGVAPCIV